MISYTKGECTCRLFHTGLDDIGIDYCPLHKAAPELYEACKTMRDILTRKGYDVPDADKAIAKVEGGK